MFPRVLLALLGCQFILDGEPGNCMLYPVESESRQLRELNGLWQFKAEKPNSDGLGFTEKWYKTDFRHRNDTIQMPVPASFNDITESKELRDHVGWVWYQRTFFVSKSWNNDRIVLRFESVNYFAVVWVNGINVVNHTGGHLPFEAEISEAVNFDRENSVTVAVNNTLSHSTIPPGDFHYKTGPGYPAGYFEQTYPFDFFNFAGIQRLVKLYTTPEAFISDIHVVTSIHGVDGWINYDISVEGNQTGFDTEIRLFAANGKLVGVTIEPFGQITVCTAHLWWPRGMNETPGYLYTMQVTITPQDGSPGDVYRIPVGIRTVRVTPTAFLINERPFYFKGVDMHEDSEIRGRGFDYVILAKDYNIIDWLGATAFRSSHYPYAEERLFEADRRGIVVIGESPGVDVRYFSKPNLLTHARMLSEMIARDRNHPSVVMWSMANEAKTEEKGARTYFKQLIDVARTADASRPVTIVLNSQPDKDQTADLVDVICVNRYIGWYHEMGHTELIQRQVIDGLTDWNKKFGKPIIQSEYGAGSVCGINAEPSVDFSESYQVQVLAEHHKAFDELRSEFLIGELIWNLIDFATPQTTTRVGSVNRKGIFTRNRQPKMAAYALRQRYLNFKEQT